MSSPFSGKICIQGVELAKDLQQFIDPMRAGVPAPDRSQPVGRQRVGKLRIALKVAQMSFHAFGVLRDQKIAPRAKSPSTSLQIVDAGGMPQASASNTRIVVSPGAQRRMAVGEHGLSPGNAP